MVTGNLICIGPIGTNSGASYFVLAPFACHVHDVHVVAQNSDIGDDDTVTIKNGISGTTIGTATFGSDIAAGAKATYVAADANQEIAANGIIEVAVSALNAAGDRVHVVIELDPYRLEA